MNRQQILATATDCVTRDRAATHGKPENNFGTIAAYYTTYLRSRGLLAEGASVAAVDVAALSIFIKLSRSATSPEHPDHWVDIAGYAACGGEIATGG